MSMFSVIWQTVLLSTFWCIGVYMNSEKGDIFYFLRALTSNLSPLIHKPVIGCINCMASLHTAIVMIIYFSLMGIVALWWQYIIIWLIAAVITSGANGIVYKIYLWLSAYTDNLNYALEEAENEKTPG